MSLFTDLPVAPRVWIGCLACYNNGTLTGDWHRAGEAGDVTPDKLHGHETSHEELWVFDHEGLPVTGELSPHHAALLVERINQVDEHLRDAFRAWVLDGAVVEDAEGLPTTYDFEERYTGEWDSFYEYAHQLADEVGLLNGVDEEIARYFNWDAWTNDLAYDYSVVDAPCGGVYVFRNL